MVARMTETLDAGTPHLSADDARGIVAANARAAIARRRARHEDLADLLNLHRTSLSRRLNGHYPFTVDELHSLSIALEVPLDDLLEGAGAPSNP